MRQGQRSRKAQTRAERTGVNQDQRLVEPLGIGVPWGFLDQLEGRYAGAPVPMTRQIIIIGRQMDCDIILDDERISRYHVFLTWEQGQGFVRDNQSTNGTRVNGQAVLEAVALKHGDIIEAGGSQFRFTYSEASGLAVMEAQPTDKFSLPRNARRVAAPVVRARLSALTGPEPGRSWPIAPGVTLIGRGGDALIVLPHTSVSRHHAQIISQPTGLYIQDIGSSNGTSVNGTPLEAPVLLHSGDHVQIGDIALVITIEEIPADLPLEEMPTQQLPSVSSLRPAISRPGAGSSASGER
jgi:ABC transport system ATP-binding/permease protein